MNICPSSGLEITFQPPGISKKTGKPYQGFFKCPNMGCPGPHNAPTAEVRPQPAQKTTPLPETSRYGAFKPQGSQSGGDSKDEFWEKKAFKQCLWNYWLRVMTTPNAVLLANWEEEVWKIFKQIEKSADGRFDIPFN